MVQGMFSKVEGLYNNPQLSTTSFVGTTEYIAPEVIQGFGQSSAVDWWTLGILIFEMLFGRTPFRDDSNNQTLKNILDKGVKIPKENHHGKISSDCKNFIKKLLHTNPKKRLGSKKGAIDIKKQDWFEDVNFPLIRNETPPFVPKMSSKHDTRHFRAHLDERELSNSSESESSGAEFDEFADVERNPRHPGAKAE
jgi:protein-serine/threonine kinase